MTTDTSPVESEIESHKSELNGWVDKVSKLQVLTSKKGVTDRFVRDCNLMITDLDGTEQPTTSDLNDFNDRKNNLEVQFFNISQDHP